MTEPYPEIVVDLRNIITQQKKEIEILRRKLRAQERLLSRTGDTQNKTGKTLLFEKRSGRDDGREQAAK